MIVEFDNFVFKLFYCATIPRKLCYYQFESPLLA